MGFALHPYSDWLVIISLNEVLKVGGIQKSQVIRQAEFSRAFGARLLAPSALVFSRLCRQNYTRTNTIPPATQATPATQEDPNDNLPASGHEPRKDTHPDPVIDSPASDSDSDTSPPPSRSTRMRCRPARYDDFVLDPN